VVPALGGEGAAGDLGEGWNAEVDRGATGSEIVELGEFVVGGGEADLQSFDLAEPAFTLSFVDAGGQVVADVGQAVALGGIGS
jgi:hypothetical protein